MGVSNPYAGATAAAGINDLQVVRLAHAGTLKASFGDKVQATVSTVAAFTASPTSYNRSSPFVTRTSSSVGGTGTITWDAAGLVTGTNTLFLKEVKVGNYLDIANAFGGVGTTHRSRVVHIADDNTLQLDGAPEGTADGTGRTYAIVSAAQQLMPILHHPYYYFNSSGSEVLGQFIWNLYSAVNSNVATAVTSSPFVTAATLLGGSNLANTLTMSAEVTTRAIQISQRAADATVNALIATYVSDITAALEVKRTDEIAAMMLQQTAANGFFNSNLLNRVNEINNRYNTLIAEKRAEQNLKYRELVYQQALTALQILATYENKPLSDRLEIEKFVLAQSANRVNLVTQGYESAGRLFAAGIGYGAEQAKRDYANDTLMFHGLDEACRAEAEIMQLYTATGMGGAGKGVNAGSIINGALGGASAGTAIGAALSPATAGASIPVGALIGGGAGLLLGGLGGALR